MLEREQADRLEGSRLSRIVQKSTSSKREPGGTLSTGAGAEYRKEKRRKLKHRLEEEHWGRRFMGSMSCNKTHPPFGSRPQNKTHPPFGSSHPPKSSGYTHVGASKASLGATTNPGLRLPRDPHQNR